MSSASTKQSPPARCSPGSGLSATHERSADVTAQAMDYLRALFSTPRSPGIELATDALGQVAQRDDVTSTMVGYTRDLLTAFNS